MSITIIEKMCELYQQKYVLNFHGTYITTTVTSSPFVVRKWLSYTLSLLPHYVRNRLIIGLGVQWNPKFTPTQANTIQLCIGCRCLVFQISRSPSVPLLLRRFLLNPSYTFVGMWNHSDKSKLERSRHALQVLRVPVDLRFHVRSKRTGENLMRAAREDIVKEVLGLEVLFDKDVGMSEWDSVVLNEWQVSYAVVDAYVSFLIGKGLKAWNLSCS